ncbi:MAG: type II toxin-antitoxin system RelE/ParE family toxin [Myxococcota bacterium]
MRALVISARAEDDLREIWLWSYNQFGEDQADRYLDQLDEGLQRCGLEPHRGKSRDALRSGYWSKVVRKHIAFYTFTDDQVVIQRVLHGSMDPQRHV